MWVAMSINEGLCMKTETEVNTGDNGVPNWRDWEWIVGAAVAKLKGTRFVIKESLLNVGEDQLMRRCRCGRKFYDICVDCFYRKGGALRDVGEHEDDLCEQMADLVSDAGYRLENALRWMGVQGDQLIVDS